MQGVRARLELLAEEGTRQSWEAAAFSSLAAVGKLKALRYYLRQRRPGQTPKEMLAVMREFQARGARMTIRRIEKDS